MGIGGISIWQLLIILVIVLVIFGGGKLKGIGSDLGAALKGFKKSMSDDDSGQQKPAQVAQKSKSSSAGSGQSPRTKTTRRKKTP